MSNVKQISEHNDALSIYLDDMLFESSADIPKKPPAPKENIQANTENWKNTPFQVISFDVNGLNMAIHQQDVKAILPWSETQLGHISETAKTNDAILGSFQYASSQITIINALHVFLPAELRHSALPPSFIIVLGDGKWALSCHKVNTVAILSPDDIKWRKKASTRPWLAGTSVANSCSIIDIAELIQLFK